MEYRGIVKERDRRMNALFIALAVFMLALTLMTHKWFYIPMALLVILACYYRREHIISERGVEIRSLLFGWYIRKDLWRWDEVGSMETNYEKAAPNVQLLITNDIVIRAFVMTRKDVRGALALARRMNPSIQMNELTEEEQERRDAAILHQQEIEKAQQRSSGKSDRQKKKKKNKKNKKK